MRRLIEELRRLVESEPAAHHPHERCPDGSHWNDKQNKCLALKDVDRELLYAKTAADSRQEPWKSPQYWGQTDAQHAEHWDGQQKAHGDIAKRARQLGFHGLASEHDKKKNVALDHREKHQKYASSAVKTPTRKDPEPDWTAASGSSPPRLSF